MDKCLFCQIVANETPSYTVYEDEKTRAFLDIFPSTPGHVVVVLKKHGWAIQDYNPEELMVLMATVQKIVSALTVVYKTEVFTIGMNHKEQYGVHHMHFHILPRFSDDGGSVIQSVVEKDSKHLLTDIASMVKNAIK
ncbi:MAG: HIT family protein [Candidatus Gottesmanbacteria bacterium]